MTKYNTNLAAEFYVLSMLHRLGAEAYLTLGNMKSVDIVIKSAASTLTLDVKGLAGPNDWPADNIRLPAPRDYFFAFLSFEGKMPEPTHAPRIWIIPADEVSGFIKEYKTRRVVSCALVKEHGDMYLNGWHVLGISR